MRRMRPACPRRTLTAPVLSLALAALMGARIVVGTAMPAAAQSAPCSSLELEVAITPTQPPECLSGSSSDGDFSGEWEYIQMIAGDRFIAVAQERAGIRSVFYLPRLESVVPTLLGQDAESVGWGTGISDERFTVRRFEVAVDDGSALPCAGFVATGGASMGSEVKSAVYGYVCNVNGLAFSDAEVSDILSRIDD